MKPDGTRRSHRATSGLTISLAALAAALLAACATPDFAPAPTVVVPPIATPQVVQATLRSLNFDQREDGYHLSLPAPLIFPFDSTELSPEARDILINVGRELNDLGIDRALVYGYTDSVGPPQYNVALSTRRAEMVARAVADGGYPASRVVVKGLGASLPIADNSTALGRSQNRRVVIIVQMP